MSSDRAAFADRLCLGTAQLAAPYGFAARIGRGGRPNPAALLDAATALGVARFDTASAYPDSEEALGRWLGARRPEGAQIFTKLAKARAVADADLPAWAEASAQLSVERLGTKTLDGLMLHSADDLRRPPVRAALESLRGAGRTGRAGASVYGLEDAAFLLRETPFDLLQVPLWPFVVDPAAAEVSAACEAADAVVMIRSVFLQGLLLAHPAALPAGFESARPMVERIREIAAAAGIRVSDLCLSLAAAAAPPGALLIVGADDAAQLRGLLPAAPAPDGAVEEALAALRRAPAFLLDPRRWPKPAA